MSLDYFLSEKEGLVVISLKGEFRESSGALLLKCLQDALGKLPKGIVIHIAGVATMPREALRDFGRFLRDIRVNGTPFRISLKNERIRQDLVQAGIIDRSEAKDSLEEAAKQVWLRIKAGA